MLDEIKSEITRLVDKAKDLGTILKIQDKKKTLGKLEKEAEDPTIWQNQERAKKLLQEKKGLEKEISTWEELSNGVEDLNTLVEMAKDEDASEIRTELTVLAKKAHYSAGHMIKVTPSFRSMPGQAAPMLRIGPRSSCACTRVGQKAKAIKLRSRKYPTVMKPG